MIFQNNIFQIIKSLILLKLNLFKIFYFSNYERLDVMFVQKMQNALTVTAAAKKASWAISLLNATNLIPKDLNKYLRISFVIFIL